MLFLSTRNVCHKALKHLSVQEVTPWDVKGGADGKIDYEKLSRDVRPLIDSCSAPLRASLACVFPRSATTRVTVLQFGAVWMLAAGSRHRRQVAIFLHLKDTQMNMRTHPYGAFFYVWNILLHPNL